MNPEEYRISLLVRKKASLHSLIIYIKKRVYVKSYMATDINTGYDGIIRVLHYTHREISKLDLVVM